MTPTAAPWNQGGCGGEPEKQIKRLLPTPRAAVDKEHGPDGRHWGELRPTLMQLLPTPTAADGERMSQTYGRGNDTLRGATVKLLPTPTVNDSKNLTAPSQGDRNSLALPTLMRSLGGNTNPPSDAGNEPSDDRRLSPWFVEFLMGAPQGWSDPDVELSANDFQRLEMGSSSRQATFSAAWSSTTKKGS
jgi:hypothetical protein